jgi:CheY-like chemotaxis protein
MNVHRKKILVADCHDGTLVILEKLLEDAGFDTTTVWTAKDALSLVDSHAFDLVLVNEYLPDAHCEEVLRALQKRTGPIPCIVMQARAPRLLISLGSKPWEQETSFASIAFDRLWSLLGNAWFAMGSGSLLETALEA